jgi:glyoxylase-like metal-dependent hydrolase (beta-lactamase superfamily II)
MNVTNHNITVGNVEITSLSDGHLNFDPCAFFPSIDAGEWGPYPEALTGEHRVDLNIGSFLVRSDGRTILVDTGMGPKPDRASPHVYGELLDDMRDKAVAPEDVDMVVLTHLHRDHVGWNLRWDGDRCQPTFPRARYWLGEKDWEFFKADDAWQRFPTTPTCVLPLEELGLMELMVDNYSITSEITALLTPGHTPGHMSFLITSKGEKGLILGDAAHIPLQTHEMDWSSMGDEDPELANATRHSLFERLELEGILIAAGHFPAPGFGKLARLEGRRYWQPLQF